MRKIPLTVSSDPPTTVKQRSAHMITRAARRNGSAGRARQRSIAQSPVTTTFPRRRTAPRTWRKRRRPASAIARLEGSVEHPERRRRAVDPLVEREGPREEGSPGAEHLARDQG